MLHCPPAHIGLSRHSVDLTDVARRLGCCSIGVRVHDRRAATYSVLRSGFGDRPARIKCAGRRNDARLQQRLEQQYHLTYGQRTEGRTFSYDLTDLSRTTFARWCSDTYVEDTHYIHPHGLPYLAFAPRSKYHDGGEKWGPLLEGRRRVSVSSPRSHSYSPLASGCCRRD
jgi:hypothetical protein